MGGLNTFTLKRCSTFQFIQDTPDTTWTIQHNLNNHPVTDVLFNDNGVLTKMIPAGITYVDPNNLIITFTSPRSGVARMVG